GSHSLVKVEIRHNLGHSNGRYQLFFLVLIYFHNAYCGILHPQDSETRETKDLSGLWNFRITPLYDQEKGFREKWYSVPLEQTGEIIPMPVPSSFNDITQNRTIRDHIGWVWYDKELFIPNGWSNKSQRIFIRFGSVHYNAIVWINGINVLNHTVGHLPFQEEVTKYLKFESINRVTVAVNNTLTPETIPQGSIQFMNDPKKYPPGYFVQNYNYDFYNYAGIHRPVYLYTVPKVFIDDITIKTDILDASTGVLHYDIQPSVSGGIKCVVQVLDKKGNDVAHGTALNGSLKITNAHFWWPYLTNSTPGYQYTFKVQLVSSVSSDIYRLKIGIRTISLDNKSFFINNKKFYFRGFGKHEDSDLRGKGVDFPLIVKDFNLLKWIGANSFRTSHYPYAEEIMDRADSEGIVVIDESPAVGLDNFDQKLLNTHMQVMKELYQRDKNRPSVVMWSIGNEPKSQKPAAGPYFKQLVALMKNLDSTRPSTLVLNQDYNNDKAAQYLDVICVNRYFGWYSDIGQLDLIEHQVIDEYKTWHKIFNKPVINSEYGAETITGLHADPPVAFSEDYQVAFLTRYFSAFQRLRKNGDITGEMIWNFADFMTEQGTSRINGNKKGVFTRQRQPKFSAHIVRSHYWKLALSLDSHNETQSDLLISCME
uniref:Beta-glucuronidase n=1 Tax=Strigamia maritima TaxID=126957 RepID=T1J7V1_STRMM